MPLPDDVRPTAWNVECFEDFVMSHDSQDDSAYAPYVSYFVRNWLESGQGVDIIGGKFESYLRTIIAIGDATMKGQISYDFRGSDDRESYTRTIVGLREPHGANSYFDDPMWYDSMVASVQISRAKGIIPHSW